MNFGAPRFFWAFLLLPLLAGFFIFTFQNKQAALRLFAQEHLIRRLSRETSLNRYVLKAVLFFIFAVFLVIALVRPQFGTKIRMMQRRGVDVIVALDISRSMLAEDIEPNRLERAKYETAKFIDLVKGDRVGIIVFAGESFIQCPLTLDYSIAKMFLDAVETDWISRQGTVLADAIRSSAEAFGSDEKKYKVLLVLSDGESHEGDAVKAAKEAAREGVRIYTVGIGSEKGVPIPFKKTNGSVIYKKDKNGDLVMTHLNSEILEKIAIEADGKYFHAGTDLDLSRIYEEIDEMEKKKLGINKFNMYEERYQVFLFTALFFLLLEFFVPQRVNVKRRWRGRFE